ncbi:MAG: SpoIIE family protein phosphatase [Candidatus Fermentibacteraceae bacterium]|nr:SpoIIE family protein phosphatase [Candidatus Fermentibacteraceae bacterium]MBN2609549.1 SpoIIE family protein phosphatase [Candidatus Fermentibacteraceae bacterium]
MTEDRGFSEDILWRILDVTRQLSTPIELDDMLAEVVDVAREVMAAERGTVFLYDDGRHELFARVGTSLDVEEIRFSADDGIAGICARTLKIVNVADAYSHDGFNRRIDSMMGYTTRCILSVPLVGLHGDLVGVLQLINKKDGAFNRQDERVAEVLGSQCAVALQRARLLEEYVAKQKIEHDLSIAREIQRELLPARMPVVGGYDLAGWNLPADHTGGDIFDAIGLEGDAVLIILADACGHGIGPALSVTQFRAMIRMASRLGSDLFDLHSHANNQLVEDLSSERFITAFIGLLDSRENLIRYHACGQAPLLHYRAATGRADVLTASSLPFGILPDMPLEEPGPIIMEPGDIFALISDGIFEQADRNGDQFGVERTLEVINGHGDRSMDDLVKEIHGAVVSHAGGTLQDDDMTIVLVKREAL